MKWIFIFLLFSVPFSALGGDLAPRTPKHFLDDGLYLYSSPLKINKDNYKEPLLYGSVILGSALLDKTIYDHLFTWKNSDPSEDLRHLGDYAQVSGPVIGTLFAVHGWSADNDHSKETAYLSYETFVWAGAIEGTLKFIIGRKRPSETDHPFTFNPFSGNSSFPSGHTTEAFAAATVFSEQYPSWYVYIPAYGVAGTVGFSRTYANQHWFSDVVAGAILGCSVSHVLRKRHRHPKEYTWNLEPNANGLRLVCRY